MFTAQSDTRGIHSTSSPEIFGLAKNKVRHVATLEKPGQWISASADGKFVLYDQFDNEKSNIMLLENFRRIGNQSPNNFRTSRRSPLCQK